LQKIKGVKGLIVQGIGTYREVEMRAEEANRMKIPKCKKKNGIKKQVNIM